MSRKNIFKLVTRIDYDDDTHIWTRTTTMYDGDESNPLSETHYITRQLLSGLSSLGVLKAHLNEAFVLWRKALEEDS